MKRRRFFETLTATLLVALIMVGGFAASVMAQGNSGKNKDKDGSDDDSAFVDPGVRYAVELVDLPAGTVSARLFDCNNAGQVVGAAFSIGGVSRALLIESSGTSNSSYVLDEITEGVPPDHVIRRANAINDAGLIAVYRDDSALEGLQLYPGIVDTNPEIPRFHEIPTTDSGYAVATDINNEGDVLIIALDGNAQILGDMYLFNHGILYEELSTEGQLELLPVGNDASNPRLSDRLPIGDSYDVFVIGRWPYPYQYNMSTGEYLELAILDDGAGTTITFVIPSLIRANSWGDFIGHAITATRHKNGRLRSSTRTSYLQQSSGNLDISYPQHSFSLNDSLDVVGLDFLIHGDAGKFSIFDLLDPADAGTGVLLQNAERLTLEILSNRIMEDSDFPVVYGRVVLEDGMESVVILTPFPSE